MLVRRAPGKTRLTSAAVHGGPEDRLAGRPLRAMGLVRALCVLLSLGIAACRAPAATTGAPSGQAAAATAVPPAGAQAGADALYALAKQEGRVVHYAITPSHFDGARAAFQKRYPGISVELAGMRAPEMVSRVNAE